MVTLSDEQRLAILSGNGRPITVRDSQSDARYVLVDAETHQRAMDALQQRHQQDVEAIREGLKDVESGRVLTLEEMDARMFDEFGFPPRTE